MRRVGPSRRMNEYPNATIMLSTMRWRRLHRRGPDSGWTAAAAVLVLASGTKPILAKGRTIAVDEAKTTEQFYEAGVFPKEGVDKSKRLVFQVRIDPGLDLQPALIIGIEANPYGLGLVPTDHCANIHARKCHQSEGNLHVCPRGKIFYGL